MTKRMMILVAALVPVLAQAEVGAGTIEVTGGSVLGYSATTIDPDVGTKLEDTTFGLEVGALYYLTPMIGVGAEVAYDKTTSKFGDSETKDTTIVLAPKVGLDYHVADKVSLFAEALVGWSQAESDGTKASGLVWGLGGGLKYFLAPSFSANIGLNYRSASLKESDTDAKATASNLFVGVGFSGYFGGP